MMLHLSTLLALALTATLTAAPDTSEDCGQQVCLYGTDSGDADLPAGAAGSFKAGQHLSLKNARKDAKKNRKRKSLDLGVSVEGGRGSVFIDGRYLAQTGAHATRSLKPGKHAIEVRDGDEVLTYGTLRLSTKAGAVTIVVHVDRP